MRENKKANNLRIEYLENRIDSIGEVVIRLDNSVQVMQATLAKDSYFMGRMQMVEMQNNALAAYNKSLGGTEEAFREFWDKYLVDYRTMMESEERKARQKETGIVGLDGKPIIDKKD